MEEVQVVDPAPVVERPRMPAEWLAEVIGEHPTASDKEKWLPLVPTRREVAALVQCSALESLPQLALRTLYASGIRAEELLALKPESLDLEKGAIRAGERWVVIDSETLDHLAKTLPWAFTADELQGWLERSARATGLWQRFEASGRVILPKTLRHSFATHCLENGMDLFSLHALLGHVRWETTEMYVETAIARWLPAYLKDHPLAAGPAILRGGGPQASLTEGETMEMIEAADPGRDRLILRTAYASALRVHELTTLFFADLFLDEFRIFVRDGKDHIDRYTVIDGETARQLREWQGDQAMTASVFGIGDRQVGRIVDECAARTGLDKIYTVETISPHTFRRAHANHCYHRGIDLFALKKLMGHAYLGNTMEYVDCQIAAMAEGL
jgi:site-specific recombinase XerD